MFRAIICLASQDSICRLPPVVVSYPRNERYAVGYRACVEKRSNASSGTTARAEPAAELDARYSSEGASAASWREAVSQLEGAEVFWLATVRPNGRPHVTPLIAVWLDGALHFCTGPEERKARNLERNRSCILTTGCNAIDEGLDVVVEGEAMRIDDDARLCQLADAYVAKYGEGWRFDVRDGAFVHEGGTAIVFAVHPEKVLGFRKGKEFSQTRWRFEAS
jgi:nitroimidazol reductase NimA-like FMN-containing flavoprotein (pyridoxamine 5'-phosphate oxidase superfamily)